MAVNPPVPLAFITFPYDIFGAIVKAFNVATGLSLTVDDVQNNTPTLADLGLAAGTSQVHAFRQRVQHLFNTDIPLDLLNDDTTTFVGLAEYLFFHCVNTAIYPISPPTMGSGGGVVQA